MLVPAMNNQPSFDARNLTASELTQLRKRGVQAVQDGMSVAAVARALNVSRQAVFNWCSLYRAGGWDRLDARKRGGRPRLVSAKAMAWIYDAVTLGSPEQLKLPIALWTAKLLCEALYKKFGIRQSKASMCRVLKQLGLTPQRPLWRAWQQDPDAVERWLKKDFPAIRRAARKAGGEIWFGDEAGVRSDCHHGTTWGAKGQTPVVKTAGARFGLNLMSVVNRKGGMRFMCIAGRTTAGVVVEFLRRLLASTDKPVFLVLDGHPTHKSKTVQSFVKANRERLHLYLLPGYSPDLNPDEWVWRNLKVHGTGRQSITGPDQMKALIMREMRSMQRRPRRIQSFFRDAGNGYAA